MLVRTVLGVSVGATMLVRTVLSVRIAGLVRTVLGVRVSMLVHRTRLLLGQERVGAICSISLISHGAIEC